MSDKQTYTNIPNNVLQYLFETDLSKPALKLYLYYRKYKNNGNRTAWVGRARIVKEAHISKRDIKPARDELIRARLIAAEMKKGMSPAISFNDEVIPTVRTTTYPHSEDKSYPHSEDTTTTNDYYESTNTTPTVSEVNQTTTKGSRSAPAKNTAMKKGKNDLITLPEIQNAIRVYFELTPNWKAWSSQAFLQWAKDENITPAQIQLAADAWNADGQWNWRPPALSSIQTNWTRLMKPQYNGAVEGV